MSKFCSKCGTQLDDSAMFCTNCGEKMQVDSQPTPNQVNETQGQYTAPNQVNQTQGQYTAPNQMNQTQGQNVDLNQSIEQLGKDVGKTVNQLVGKIDEMGSKNKNSAAFGTVARLVMIIASALAMLSCFLPFISVKIPFFGNMSFNLVWVEGSPADGIFVIFLAIATIVLAILNLRIPTMTVSAINSLLGLFIIVRIPVKLGGAEFGGYASVSVGYFLFVFFTLFVIASTVVYIIFGKNAADIKNVEAVKASCGQAGKGVSEMFASQQIQQPQQQQMQQPQQQQMQQMQQQQMQQMQQPQQQVQQQQGQAPTNNQ